MLIHKIAILIVGIGLLSSCQNTQPESADDFKKEMSGKEKDYWYNGNAELTSYKLIQSRYGEQHAGHAVLIFVTEPFSPTKFVKADREGNEDISVLKLNATKKFETGIYPYSLMTSTFTPFENTDHALKISFSGQEWCGHAYMEMVHKFNPEVEVASYFEGESFDQKEIPAAFYEDEIWNLIRLESKKLKTGKTQMVPSFEFLRLYHKEVKAYAAEIVLGEGTENTKLVKLTYPELKRTLEIKYTKDFPFKILGWTEQILIDQNTTYTTEATLNKSINLDYWTKHNVQDSIYRQQLGL
ncbi:MAG: septum formation inhibitor Maf [Saprospiraceae bacterium]|nr:septum formation inhibitor Maf [Saprospiraceae bacterium]